MVSYEYLVVTLERAARTVYRCAGHTFEGASLEEARAHFTTQLAKGDVAELQRRRRDARAANDKAYLNWVTKRDERRKRFTVTTVEAQVAKGRFAMQDRVTSPDGTTRTFPKGEGLSHIDELIVAEIGPPPPELESFQDLTDGQIVEKLLAEIDARPVDVWQISTTGRRSVSTSHAPLSETVTSTLDELGVDGWRLVDVSEDRAIVSGERGTESVVVAARYTLVREVER